MTLNEFKVKKYMNWFFIALIGPLLWSIGNHIDKFLIEKYFKNRGIGGLLIISLLIGFFAAAIFFIVDPNVLNINLDYLNILFISTILFIIYVWSYLKALEDDEASVVIPFFQLIPVFAFGLGYFFLGETLSLMQIFAMILIILGATILSVDIDEENKFKLRRKTILFMLISSFCGALESVLFKVVILEESFLVSNFWTFLFSGLIGLILLFTVKQYREDFFYIIKINSKSVISLNFLNEVLATIGNVVTAFATLLAPITLVLLANAYQPLFVFFIGIMLTLFLPQIAMEKIKLKNLFQKISAISVMLIGTYFLFL